MSTKQTDRKKAMKIAEQYEQISQRKLPVHTVRQTLTALAREAYGETFPSATVHQFIEAWLKSKAPPEQAQQTPAPKKQMGMCTCCGMIKSNQSGQQSDQNEQSHQH